MFAVQIKSDSSSELALTKSEREEIQMELGDEIKLQWLPSFVKDREDGSNGFSDFSTIFVFVLGVTFASLIKPFFETLSQEAAKDVWEKLKKLLPRLISKQKGKTYRLNTRVYIFFELEDEYVAIRFSHFPDDKITVHDLEKIIEEEFKNLSKDWEDINKDIKEFGIGHRKGRKIHVIGKMVDGKYQINSIDMYMDKEWREDL